MLESLNLDPAIDYPTFQWLGNTGSAAAPISLAIGVEREFIQPGHRVALLGIGSGINCLMMELQWQTSQVLGSVWPKA